MRAMTPSRSSMSSAGELFSSYDGGAGYDEMFDAVRPPARSTGRSSTSCAPPRRASLALRQVEADKAFLTQGITFTVYGDEEGTERIFPFDLLPRIITAAEWRTLESGLTQRLTAINLFLKDVYHEGRILAEGVVPRDLVYSCRHFRREMRGVRVHRDIYVSVAGTDLVRLEDGRFVVLEDNLRVPSGVSYMLANREVTKRVMPGLFDRYQVSPIAHYGQALLATLRALAPPHVADPTFVVLTPGVGNSAYFEHAFLAREMGVALVEGRDLLVHDNIVYMRTTAGLRRVDVIYRRVDDDFLDPLAFRRDSHLGVAGLLNAYRAGKVSLANAIGTGIADDKALYAYIPAIIRFYLSEEPILDNVDTYLLSQSRRSPATCSSTSTRSWSRRWGSRAATACWSARTAPRASARSSAPRSSPSRATSSPSRRWRCRSRRASSTSGSSRATSTCGRTCSTARRSPSCPGGLTRVALRKGSLVVNSSQGGGSKDTWVLEE